MKIADIVAEYGAKNLRIFVPMQRIHGLVGFPIGFTDSSDPYVDTECMIDEERYKVSDGYKIMFRAVNDTDPNAYYGTKSYYQMDFNSMRRSCPEDFRIYILVDEDNKYERFREPVDA